jgi:hypothetical protein
MPLPQPGSPEIPSELLEGLPPRVREILQSYGHLLSQKGIVECRTERRRNPCYRLRFRQPVSGSRTKHRSISLGCDPALATRVDRILARWHSLRDEARRIRREEEQERRRERAERRRLQDLVMLSARGGRRHRRRIRKHVDDLVNSNDPVAGLRVLAEIEKGWTSPSRRGRPRRGKQLW